LEECFRKAGEGGEEGRDCIREARKSLIDAEMTVEKWGFTTNFTSTAQIITEESVDMADNDAHQMS
jgi:ribosome-associated toxin RatA of RatAB toxin-antitoxin module